MQRALLRWIAKNTKFTQEQIAEIAGKNIKWVCEKYKETKNVDYANLAFYATSMTMMYASSELRSEAFTALKEVMGIKPKPTKETTMKYRYIIAPIDDEPTGTNNGELARSVADNNPETTVMDTETGEFLIERSSNKAIAEYTDEGPQD